MGSANFDCCDGIALLGCPLCDGRADGAGPVIRAAVGDLVQFDLHGEAWQK
jgi:hypothetical protein